MSETVNNEPSSISFTVKYPICQLKYFPLHKENKSLALLLVQCEDFLLFHFYFAVFFSSSSSKFALQRRTSFAGPQNCHLTKTKEYKKKTLLSISEGNLARISMPPGSPPLVRKELNLLLSSSLTTGWLPEVSCPETEWIIYFCFTGISVPKAS